MSEAWVAEGCLTGHYWHGGSQCSACGERLRCLCGQFVREDALVAHEAVCPWLSAHVADDPAELALRSGFGPRWRRLSVPAVPVAEENDHG